MSTVGLDVGTSRIKAVRFDESGQPVDVEAVPASVIRTDGGGREQDMAAVWTAAARVLARVMARSADRVTLVALTGQGDGCWLVDAEGGPAGRAMLWNDSRAARIVRQWQADGLLDEAFRRSGCQGAPGLAHAQLTWLLQHDPARLERATTLLSCGSWIYLRLTGRRVLDVTEAANPFFDARTRSYEPALLDLFGLTDQRRLLPPFVDGADRAARVLPDVAAELGLDARTVICLAPYDVPATAIGTGVVAPGQAFGVLGTTLCVGTVAGDPLLDRPPNGMTLPGTTPDRWLVAYATMIGTEVLDWTAGLLGLPDAAAVTALAEASTRVDLPTVLPYLSPAGERSPFLDDTIRGTVTDLDTGHGRADIAKAAVESLALVVAECLAATGRRPATLSLSGGGAASEVWSRAISDATAVPVLRPGIAESGARGAVLSGSVDTCLQTGLDGAVATAVRDGERIDPDPDRTAYFAERYERFVAVRARVRG